MLSMVPVTYTGKSRNRFLFTGTTGGNKIAGGWRYIRETHSLSLSLS